MRCSAWEVGVVLAAMPVRPHQQRLRVVYKYPPPPVAPWHRVFDRSNEVGSMFLESSRDPMRRRLQAAAKVREEHE